jgi:RimJ/RimL family protein N-acetyltransferase
VLKGKGIVLRGIERTDLPKILELRKDAELERLVYGAPFPHSLAGLEAAFDADAAKPAADRDGFEMGIEVDGTLIGRISLFHFDRIARTCRLGISIERSVWNKGYGRDAVSTILRYAFEDLNLHRVSLDTMASNERAIRSYLACGFVEEGRLRQYYWFQGRYVDAVEMGILRDEWLAARD